MPGCVTTSGPSPGPRPRQSDRRGHRAGCLGRRQGIRGGAAAGAPRRARRLLPVPFRARRRVRLADRTRLIHEGLQVLHWAFTGEPFRYRGRTARVTPRPSQDPLRPPPAVLRATDSDSCRRSHPRNSPPSIARSAFAWSRTRQVRHPLLPAVHPPHRRFRSHVGTGRSTRDVRDGRVRSLGRRSRGLGPLGPHRER